MPWFIPSHGFTKALLGAGSATRFGETYFKTLVAGLGDKVWLGVVKKEEAIVATFLVLEGAQFAHSHPMV